MRIYIVMHDKRGYEGGIESDIAAAYLDEERALQAVKRYKSMWQMGENDYHVHTVETRD